MVGSVIPGRPNVIEREAAVKLLNRFTLENRTVGPKSFPAILIHLVQARSRYVALAGHATSLLYTMDSPGFLPRFYKPLDNVAIGSGEGTIDNIRRAHNMIIGGPPMENGEAMWLTMAMEDFIKEQNLPSVGGMFTLVRLGEHGLTPLERTVGRLPNGPFFELAFQDGRWIQRNQSTGKEIKLSFPWEIDLTDRQNNTFDDLRHGL